MSYFGQTCHFLDRFLTNAQIRNFMKILPVGAASFGANGRKDGRADGRTERS